MEKRKDEKIRVRKIQIRKGRERKKSGREGSSGRSLVRKGMRDMMQWKQESVVMISQKEEWGKRNEGDRGKEEGSMWDAEGKGTEWRSVFNQT